MRGPRPAPARAPSTRRAARPRVTLRLAGDLGLRKILDLLLAARRGPGAAAALRDGPADAVQGGGGLLRPAGRRHRSGGPADLGRAPAGAQARGRPGARDRAAWPTAGRVELATAAPGGALNCCGARPARVPRYAPHRACACRGAAVTALSIRCGGSGDPRRPRDPGGGRPGRGGGEHGPRAASTSSPRRRSPIAENQAADGHRGPGRLARLVPDQAHIQLEPARRHGTAARYAATASELIGLLDESQLFKTPQFRSPVTQDPRSGSERFHLSVELAPPEGS